MAAGQEGVSSLEGMSSTLRRQLKQPRERCEWISIDTNLKKKFTKPQAAAVMTSELYLGI
jgi:hypothetical protein